MVSEEGGERVNILIVDDRPDELLRLEGVLEELGQNVVTAGSGREALRHVLGTELAVILLDVNMPGLDGFETAALIQQHGRSKDTPIVFLTASGDDLGLERACSLGAVDYILTPVLPVVLRTKVGAFVDLFRKTRDLQRGAESLRRRAERLERLTSASLLVSSAGSLEAVIAAVTDGARAVIDAQVAVTTVALDPPPAPPRQGVSSSDGRAEDVRGWTARPDAITSRVLELGRAVRLSREQIEADPAWSEALRASPFRPTMRGLLSAPLLDATGRVLGAVEAMGPAERELTEEDEAILGELAQVASVAISNRVCAEAREANRLKDELLATLSHELRTPLTAILGWARVLRSASGDAAKLGRGLDVIERNARAQASLIDELLDVSRIAAGKLKLSPRPVEIGPLVEAAVDAARPAAQGKAIALVVRMDPEAGMVDGDPERLQQVAANLIGNAVKFTPRGGHVDVLVARRGDRIELRVSDDGAGIAPELLPFVFDRFRQADGGTRRQHGGLGVGLSVVRHLVELHGGVVRAESQGPERGATFTVELPAAADVDPRPGRRL